MAISKQSAYPGAGVPPARPPLRLLRSAPNCRAFAEDVVLGRASEDDCIFQVRERMRDVAGPGGTDAICRPPFRQKKPEQSER